MSTPASSPPVPSTIRPTAARPPAAKELARRVRASRMLSGTLKRYWLSVLPHLQPDDRVRLDAILRGDSSPSSTDTPTMGVSSGQ